MISQLWVVSWVKYARIIPLRSCKIFVIYFVLAFLAAFAAPVQADQQTDLPELAGIIPVDTSKPSIYRTLRPPSKIAENFTVITVEDIARLNAHTLAEVLNTIPGIQIDQVQTPGSWASFNIHGAYDAQSHILVLIDGVQQGNLIQGMLDVGLIPVQQIDRIEIIKGAASAAWGQALGGVVNIITKSPDRERNIGGIASASFGERATTDLTGEVSGTINRFGYYLSGGTLHSSGLLPNNGINNNTGYGKFTYDLPEKGTLAFGLNYQNSHRGLDENNLVHDDHDQEKYWSFLNFSYPFTDRLKLELQAKTVELHGTTYYNENQGVIIPENEFRLKESTRGGSAKLTWGDNLTNVVAGVDYEHGETQQWDALAPDSPYLTDRTKDALGLFTNSAYSIGKLTILPGVRFDHTGLGDDLVSYTLGATYRLTDTTTLRSYGAKGYSLPNAIWNSGPQHVKTVQIGMETSAIPYLWVKLTGFYNKVWHIENYDFAIDPPQLFHSEQIRQGYEVEVRTTPLYGVSLTGGYTYTDAKDQDTRERVPFIPVNQAKIGILYDEKNLGLKGTLTSNYVDWHAPADNNPHDKSFIWDLHLNQKLWPNKELSPELFFSVRNLFNGAQYQNDSTYSTYKNAPRWIEGGVRFKF